MKMYCQMIRIICILAMFALSHTNQGLSQELNTAGMGTIDPRQPQQNFESNPTRTTADVLREAGLVVPPTEKQAGKQTDSVEFTNSWTDDNQRLYLAAGGGALEEVLVLLRNGANVNYMDPANGLTPLMTAQKTAQAAALLAAGADVNITDRQGNTALHHVLFAEEAERIANLLLACGADVNSAATGNGLETPLLAARQLFFEGRDPTRAERIIRMLVYAGADLNAQDDMGYTVLMTAAVNNKPRLAQLMVDLGANVDVRSSDGKTALDWARQLGSKEVEQVLLEAGARK